MNTHQQRYAIKRIDEIETRKANEIRAKHTTPGKSVTNSELNKLLKAGKLPLRKDLKFVRTYDLKNIFDLSGLISDATTDQDKVSEEKERLNKLATAIRDEIVLGDEEKARKMIEDFSKQ